MSTMPELKKKAMPSPTAKRSQTSWNASDTRPVARAAADDTAIPRMVVVRRPYFAANIPEGIWNIPTPMRKAADIAPRSETSWPRSDATSGNMAAMLNQFTP